MKGKIFTILGIIFILLSAGAYILFEAYVKDTSNLTAINVVVAKQDIAEDVVIHNVEEAKAYFEVKRLPTTNVVSGAVTVGNSEEVDSSLWGKLCSYFSKSEPDDTQLKQFVGLKITRAYVKNEQIIASFTSTDIMEFGDEDRMYTPSNLNIAPAMATELHKGDYVDLWIIKKDAITGEITASSFYGPLQIYKLKDGDSNELTGSSTSAAVYPIFKLSNTDIANITARLEQPDCLGCFVVKYGKRPTAEQLSSNFLNNNTNEDTKDEGKVEIEVSKEDVEIVIEDVEDKNNIDTTNETTEITTNSQVTNEN